MGWQLTLRLARRELRGGVKGFRVFLACLALGVAMIAGVGSLAASIRAGLAADAQIMLGGDVEFSLALREATDAEKRYLASAGQSSAAVSEIVDMRAMARSADGAARSLIELKAVDRAYPLYGVVALSNGQNLAAALAYRDGMWGAAAAATLLDKMGLKLGDSIRVGAAQFILRATIDREPEAAISFELGPRLLIAQDALPETGLLVPGAMITHRYRVRLPSGADRASYVAGLKVAFPEAGWQIREAGASTPMLQDLLDRVGLFLSLVGLTALLVGGVGIANAVRGYLASRTESIAVFKSLGAPGHLVFQVYLLQIVTMAMLGIAAGLAIGAATPFIAMGLLPADFALPARYGLYAIPLSTAAASGLLTTLIFALGPLAAARLVPPAMLFRSAGPGNADSPNPVWKLRGRFDLLVAAAQAIAVGLLAALVIATTADRRLAAWSVLGALAALAVFRIAGVLVVEAVRRLGRPPRLAARLAVASLARPGATTSSTISSLGLGLTVLIALTLVQGNIARTLDKNLPERAPSFFFIDIQPGQTADFDALVASFPGIDEVERVPSLRGRLEKLNGVPAEQASVAPNAQWAVRNEHGLTEAAAAPKGSRVVAGAWWPSDYNGPPLVSLDSGLAKGMGLAIGDTLTVNALGHDVTARIANLREIDWTSLGINFAMVFSPGTFAGAPETDIATARVPPERAAALERAVTDRFPNISAIAVQDALGAVGRVVAAVAGALQLSAALALGSALLVLAGALAATRRQRFYEAVVLKVLGATRGDLLASYLIEYGLLGGLAAALAAPLGSLAAYLILTRAMHTDWVFLPGALALSAGAVLALTLALGFAGTWRALGSAATPYLRNE